MVDLIEPSEILVDPIELMELCPVERPKVDLNDSTRCNRHQLPSLVTSKNETNKIFVRITSVCNTNLHITSGTLIWLNIYTFKLFHISRPLRSRGSPLLAGPLVQLGPPFMPAWVTQAT